MPALAKAKLIELDQLLENDKPGGQQVEVQFNPETLKVVQQSSLGTTLGRSRMFFNLQSAVLQYEQIAATDVKSVSSPELQ